jgi:hypothetical protein
MRGMANHGPMHWRGDRTGGLDHPSAQPDRGTFDEVAALKKFQAGFTDLLGRSGPIANDAMEAFTAFNRRHDAPLADASLRQRALQKGGELTYTGTPPGSGVRVGIDRDEDGVLVGDEEDAGSDPANAAESSAISPARIDANGP